MLGNFDRLVTLVAGAVALLFGAHAPSPASAQQSMGASAAAIDDVVVTARKREEVLQDVPLSIQSFSRTALRQSNMRALPDLAETTLGLSLPKRTSDLE